MSTPPWSPSPALSGSSYSAVELDAAGERVFLLEQRALPKDVRYVTCESAASVADGIRDMIVRGAPAIGITAAYGIVLAAKDAEQADEVTFESTLMAASNRLLASRPTAVNLAWAVRRMLAFASTIKARPGPERHAALAEEARTIHRQDVRACRAMGEHGGKLLPDEGAVLTHCNAGALATGGYGSALGVIRGAIEQGKRLHVLADETRPYLQGARLTAWELDQDGISVEVIADNMAGHFMRTGEVKAIVVGADRIARNGDVANKIGTYSLACLANHHGVPFYVAAPVSTFDADTPTGDGIVIEQRSRDEIAELGGVQLVPDGVGARHPAFDVTPAVLVSKIITEMGVFEPGALAAEIA